LEQAQHLGGTLRVRKHEELEAERMRVLSQSLSCSQQRRAEQLKKMAELTAERNRIEVERRLMFGDDEEEETPKSPTDIFPNEKPSWAEAPAKTVIPIALDEAPPASPDSRRSLRRRALSDIIGIGSPRATTPKPAYQHAQSPRSGGSALMRTAPEEPAASEEDGCASSIREALEIDPEKAENETFEDPTDEPRPFYVSDTGLNFPVASDRESLVYRAEAIRAHLETAVGVDRLIALMNDLESKGDEERVMASMFGELNPEIICLAQQLLVITEELEG
jgi:hypothetical protein